MNLKAIRKKIIKYVGLFLLFSTVFGFFTYFGWWLRCKTEKGKKIEKLTRKKSDDNEYI